MGTNSKDYSGCSVVNDPGTLCWLVDGYYEIERTRMLIQGSVYCWNPSLARPLGVGIGVFFIAKSQVISRLGFRVTS